MCEKCGPFDERIALYQNLLRAILDQQTVHGIGELIRKLEAQKSDAACRSRRIPPYASRQRET
jgi:hypothetical protein